MNEQKKPLITLLLKPASYGKRALSFAIDLVLTIVLGVVLYLTVGQQLVIGKSDYYACRDAYREATASSHLGYEFYCDTCASYFEPSFMEETASGYTDPEGHVLTKSTTPNTYTMKDGNSDWLDTVKLNNVEMHPYQLYEVIVREYFTEYLHSSAFDGMTIRGKTYSEFYTMGYLVNNIYEIKEGSDGNPTYPTNSCYEPAKDAQGNWDYAAQPVVISDKYDVANSKSARDAVANYFNDSSTGTGLYADAVNHLKRQITYTTPVNRMNLLSYLALLPAVVVPPLILFIILPLCLRNGKTLGKLLLKISVVRFNGFKASWLRKLIRYVFVFAGFCLLLIPYTIIALMAMALYFAVGYLILAISKTSQALHDKVANTLVVADEDSILFKDQEEKEAYILANPDSLAAQLDRKEKEGDSEEPKESEDGEKIIEEKTE